jgi:drug/metabolite transporter (DMT)-like permease
MGLMHEELSLSYKENTIYRWQTERTKNQWIAVGIIFLGLVASWLADGRKGSLIAWGVGLAVVIILAVLDIRYADMITKGKEQYYEAAMESLRTRQKLEEKGFFQFDTKEEQQRLYKDMPAGRESFALAWYLVLFGICLAFFLWHLLK